MSNKICNIVRSGHRYDVFGTNQHVSDIAKIIGKTWSPSNTSTKANVTVCSTMQSEQELHKQVTKIRSAGYEVSIVGEKGS